LEGHVPLYDYKCENGHRFEVRQNIRDDALKTCIECGAPARRVIHPVGIVFKGSGFYATDSRKKASESGSDGSSEDGGKKNADSADGKDGKDGKKDAAGEKTAAGASGEKTAANASSEGSTASAASGAASKPGAGSSSGGSSESKN